MYTSRNPEPCTASLRSRTSLRPEASGTASGAMRNGIPRDRRHTTPPPPEPEPETSLHLSLVSPTCRLLHSRTHRHTLLPCYYPSQSRSPPDSVSSLRCQTARYRGCPAFPSPAAREIRQTRKLMFLAWYAARHEIRQRRERCAHLIATQGFVALPVRALLRAHTRKCAFIRDTSPSRRRVAPVKITCSTTPTTAYTQILMSQ